MRIGATPVIATTFDASTVRTDLRLATTGVVATALHALLLLTDQARSTAIAVFEAFDTAAGADIANTFFTGPIIGTGRRAFVVHTGVTKAVFNTVVIARTLSARAPVRATIGADGARR